MPYFYDPLQDQDQNQQQGASGGQQVQISGASANPSSTQPSTGGGAAGGNAQKSNTGSGFQNLDKYFQNNNAQQFGNQVTGKVQGQVQNAQTGMEQASDRFKTQVKEANTTPTQQQLNEAVGNPLQADAKQYQDWTNQAYKGPNNLSESQDVSNQFWGGVGKANEQAKLLGSEPGRFTLLDSYFKRPNYNFGQKSLDNLLLQQSGSGQKSKDLQNQAASLYATGNQQAKELQGAAAGRSKEIDQSKQAARQAIGIDDQGNVVEGDNAGALGKEYKLADDYTSGINDIRHKDQETIRNALQSGSLTADQMSALGITNDSDLDAQALQFAQQNGMATGQNLYNLDLSSYLSNGQDATRNQTMSADQRARIQALSQMAGIGDTFSGTPDAQGAAYSFDKARFQNDQAGAAATVKGLQDTINGLYAQQPTPNLNDPASVKAYRDWNAQVEAARKQLDTYNPGRRLQTAASAPLLLPSRTTIGSR